MSRGLDFGGGKVGVNSSHCKVNSIRPRSVGVAFLSHYIALPTHPHTVGFCLLFAVEGPWTLPTMKTWQRLKKEQVSVV